MRVGNLYLGQSIGIKYKPNWRLMNEVAENQRLCGIEPNSETFISDDLSEIQFFPIYFT